MSVADTGSQVTKPDAENQIRNRIRTAWIVLLTSFAIFLFFAISVPLAGRWYLEHATVAQLATLQGAVAGRNEGVTRVELPGIRDHVAIGSGDTRPDVVEGTVVRTDGVSQAVVTFFDRSILTIFPNSTVTLKEMRKPRFGHSSQPNRIVLLLDNGRLRVQVAPDSTLPMHFEVHTPQAPPPQGRILLQPGSYSIEASSEKTHVSVRSGQLQAKGQSGPTVQVGANQRAEIPLGSAANGPYDANRNLLANSNFESPEHLDPISQGWLTEEWFATSHQGDDGDDVNGTVDIDSTGTTRALHFKREGSNNNHGETGVEQTIDRVVNDYESLVLRFDVQLTNQSLSGGGEQSSEFPLMVRVDYEDRHGNAQHWVQGFFYQNPVGFSVINGVQIPSNTWYTYEVDLSQTVPNLHTLNRIRLYASGWDWESYVSELELRAN